MKRSVNPGFALHEEDNRRHCLLPGNSRLSMAKHITNHLWETLLSHELHKYENTASCQFPEPALSGSKTSKSRLKIEAPVDFSGRTYQYLHYYTHAVILAITVIFIRIAHITADTEDIRMRGIRS
ncbi:hypothetical protein V6N13_054551 [Hibiscus sabdariffa]